MKILNFSITNFFGFSEEGLLGDGLSTKLELKDYNLIVGKNDSGKSCLTKAMIAVSDLLRLWLNQRDWKVRFTSVNTGSYILKQLNLLFYNKDVTKNIEYEIEYELNNETKKLFSSLLLKEGSGLNLLELDKLQVSIYFHGNIVSNAGSFDFLLKEINFYNKSNNSLIYSYNMRDKKDRATIIPSLRIFSYSLQQIVYIPPIRDFKEMTFKNALTDSNPTTIPAEKIKDKLRDLKEGNEIEYKTYKRFEKFILDLTQDDKQGKNRRIVFPKDSEVGISNDKNVLPLSSYGSGIEQLFALAAHTVMHGTHRLIIIEEPEVHLHPDLQRRFFQYIDISNQINEETKDEGLFHQYIILSHSSVFINEMLNKKTQIIRAYKKEPRTNQTILVDLQTEGTEKLLDDLGVRGSDLLQSNGIVWLEEPSDRIYLKKWLDLYCQNNGLEQFEENIDYSIAFYGGSILSWFNISDEIPEQSQINKQVEEFINLLKINRHPLVIMDRDQELGKKWDTKKRIEREIGEANSIITKGKEIENYLTKEAIERAYPNLVKEGFTCNSNEAFDSLLIVVDKKETEYKANKTKFAIKVCENMEIDDLKNNSELYDLVEKIYNLIVSWNKESV